MAWGLMLAQQMQDQPSKQLLRVLHDSGGSKSMCHKRVLPKGARVQQGERRTLMRTLVGNCAPLGSVDIKGMRLPAFDKNRAIDEHEFQVFDSECQHDVMLGADFVERIGLL